MKKNIFILAIMLGLSTFFACEKDEDKVYITENPAACALQTPVTPDGLAFVKADAGKYMKFSWTSADFGFQASIFYGVQISLTDNFAESVTIISTQNLNDSARVSNINDALIVLNLPVEEPAIIKCRVFATVSTEVDSVFSTITEYTVTPFETLIAYPMIYVPGAYQGWSPGAENGRLYSYNLNSVYNGIIRLDGGEFKVTPAPNWDNAWGGSLTLTGNDYAGTLDPSGGNFSSAAGCYEFTVDLSALTIALDMTDDWGIIGTAIPPYDWSADVDMFYNGQRKMWEITGDFNAGVFKFRANDAWDLNFPSSDVPLSEAGNYTIRFDQVNST